MRRREFIAFVVGVVWPAAARAQRATRVARVGFLTTGSLESQEALGNWFDAFRQGLHEHGYADGQNIVIEVRAADGKVERFPALASELIRLKVDLIVATNSLAARAVQQATNAMPIVVPVMGDPVGD